MKIFGCNVLCNDIFTTDCIGFIPTSIKCGEGIYLHSRCRKIFENRVNNDRHQNNRLLYRSSSEHPLNIQFCLASLLNNSS